MIKLGPVAGKIGEFKTVKMRSVGRFEAERLVAMDTGSPAGCGTSIGMIAIGDKPQRPTTGYTLTLFFSNGALGNNLKWDVIEPDDEIEFEIRFLQDCEWSGQIEGKKLAYTGKLPL